MIDFQPPEAEMKLFRAAGSLSAYYQSVSESVHATAHQANLAAKDTIENFPGLQDNGVLLLSGIILTLSRNLHEAADDLVKAAKQINTRAQNPVDLADLDNTRSQQKALYRAANESARKACPTAYSLTDPLFTADTLATNADLADNAE